MSSAAQPRIQRPPTPPAVRVAWPASAPSRLGVVPGLLLLGSCIGLLISAYWCFIVVANIPMWTATQSTWFIGDALIRTALWSLLFGASVLTLCNRRSGRSLLMKWSIAHLLWVPVAFVVTTSLGEVPPEVLPPVLAAFVVGGTWAFWVALVVFGVSYWLLPAVIAIVWLRSPEMNLRVASAHD